MTISTLTPTPSARPSSENLSAPGCGPSQLETLSCLLKNVESLNASLDLQSGLQGVADHLRRSIPFDTFAILLHDELGQDLRFHFAIGIDSEVVENWRFGRGQGLVGTVAASGEPRVAHDVSREARYIAVDARIRSEAALPLVAKGRLIGVLDICSFQEDFFDDQQMRVLQLIAGHLASAIENGRLYVNLRKQTQLLSALHEASRELTSILDRQELLARVSEIVGRQINFTVFNVLLWSDERQILTSAFTEQKARGDVASGDLDGGLSGHSLSLGQGICGTAAALRQPVRVPSVDLDPRYEKCDNTDTRSELAVPLVFKDRLLGVLDLESDQTHAFREEDERFLSTLASYVAIALENSTLYERLRSDEQKLAADLRTARGIQKYLLPNKTPWIPGLQIAMAYSPARDLGGDLYDVLSYGPHRTAMVIGDVAGKGTAAALYGSLVIGMLRGYSRENCDTPLEVLHHLNTELGHLEIERRFVAMTYAVYDQQTRVLTLANAGLPYPYLVRGGEIQEIDLPGIPVGGMRSPVYQQVELPLLEGDVLVFASDGIEELIGQGQEAFGAERFQKVLLEIGDRSANKIAEGAMQVTDRFLEGREASDDRTIVVLKVTGTDRP